MKGGHVHTPTRHSSIVNQRTGPLRYLTPLLLSTILLLAACDDGAQPTSSDAPAVAQAQTDGEEAGSDAAADTSQVQVEDFQYTSLPGDARILTGQVYNPTDKVLKNVQIQVSLFDANNRWISRMSISVKDVPPGERRTFRQPVDSDLDVQGAKVRNLLVQ